MKIRTIKNNNHRRAFEIGTWRQSFLFPYAKADPAPTTNDPVDSVIIDTELGREAFTYQLASGVEGTIHIEQVLEYNQDPSYLRDQLLYKLTIEAQQQLKKNTLSKREIIRRLGTSPAQFYRLIDATNYRKSIDKVLDLLHVLDCDVELVVRERTA